MSEQEKHYQEKKNISQEMKSKVEGLMSHKLSGDTSVSVCFSPDLDIMSGDRPDTPSTESVVSSGDE